MARTRASSCANFATATRKSVEFELTMKFRVSRILGFWVNVEYQAVKDQDSGRTKSELIAQLLCEFEEAGDAMRSLDRKGRVAWKAAPKMLARLADAEQDAREDLSGW